MLWVKAFHIVFMVTWFAGLFYLPRLFVYHAEAVDQGSETDALFQTMERRLLRAIMNPAMFATWFFGLLLVLTPGIVDWSSDAAIAYAADLAQNCSPTSMAVWP